MINRKTIAEEILISGKGLHKGQESSVMIRPCEDEGIYFVIKGKKYNIKEVSAEGTGRGTTLFFPDGSVLYTVEHLLASLAGSGITDIEIEMEENCEIPVLDGSARDITESLKSAGIVAKSSVIEPAILSLPFGVDTDKGDKCIWAFPSTRTSYTFIIDFENPLVGRQVFTFIPSEMDFSLEIAPARTFGFENEIEELKRRGLVKGGTPENAVIVGEKSIKAEGGLHFPDEFVRHKLLDLIGDLSLLGVPLQANIYAFKSGHELNLQFTERLKRIFSRQRG